VRAPAHPGYPGSKGRKTVVRSLTAVDDAYYENANIVVADDFGPTSTALSNHHK